MHGWIVLTWALSLLLSWPDKVTVLTGQGNMCIRAPSSPRLELVDSLYVHCDLAAEAHMVVNIKRAAIGGQCRQAPSPALESDGSIDFQVLASGYDYLHQSQCYLCPKCRVQKADGMAIEMTQAGAPGHGGACEPAVPLPVQADGPRDERLAGGDQWRLWT